MWKPVATCLKILYIFYRVLLTLFLNGLSILVDSAKRLFRININKNDPFLKGNFAPVRVEHANIALEKVKGNIPTDLNGVYVRNGPNPQFAPVGKYHWFDGDGMLHGVQFSNGTASYTNKYIHTKKFQMENKAKKSIFFGLREFSNLLRIILWGILAKFKPIVSLFTYFPLTRSYQGVIEQGTANTAFTYHSGRGMALVESSHPTVVQLPSLTSLGTFDFNGALKHPFTAHPKIDAATHQLIFFGYQLLEKPYVKYSVANREGELVRDVDIQLPVPVMMHDMAITTNYSLLFDLPLEFHRENVVFHKPVFEFVNRPSRIGILPRMAENEKAVRWFEAKPGYFFHSAGAFEDGKNPSLIHLYAVRSESTSAFSLSANRVQRSRESDDMFDTHLPHLYHYVFNLETGKTTLEETIDSKIACEFPVIHPMLVGRQFRYVYCAMFTGDDMSRGVVKFDLSSNSSLTHMYDEGVFGGEAYFVPRPGSTREDDGYLLNYVYNAKVQLSEVLILNATNLTEICSISLPCRIPYGFHGFFVSEDELNHQRQASV